MSLFGSLAHSDSLFYVDFAPCIKVTLGQLLSTLTRSTMIVNGYTASCHIEISTYPVDMNISTLHKGSLSARFICPGLTDSSVSSGLNLEPFVCHNRSNIIHTYISLL